MLFAFALFIYALLLALGLVFNTAGGVLLLLVIIDRDARWVRALAGAFFTGSGIWLVLNSWRAIQAMIA